MISHATSRGKAAEMLYTWMDLFPERIYLNKTGYKPTVILE
jgi:hypothetical protein